MAQAIDLDTRLQQAVQSYWQTRRSNKDKQLNAGKVDAGSRGEVTGGAQMSALEGLVTDVLCDAGLTRSDIRTKTALEIPGYFRATKKWDLVVVSEGHLVLAMEFKSQAGSSIGNNVNNRSEEAVGSAKDLWTAYREGHFGSNAPTPFLGYLFLLEDRDSVNRPVSNKEPHFVVDPEFRGAASASRRGITHHVGVSYAKRYGTLCRRLVLERLYTSACFVMATNANPTRVSQPEPDMSFAKFAAVLRGHVVAFQGSRKS